MKKYAMLMIQRCEMIITSQEAKIENIMKLTARRDAFHTIYKRLIMMVIDGRLRKDKKRLLIISRVQSCLE